MQLLTSLRIFLSLTDSFCMLFNTILYHKILSSNQFVSFALLSFGFKRRVAFRVLFSSVSLIIIIGVILSKNYRKLLIFGMLFFFVNISLVLQIIPIGQAIVAERYTYIPYIGLLIIIGKVYCDVRSTKYEVRGIIFSSVLIIAVLAFSYASYARIKVWKDGITIFTNL